MYARSHPRCAGRMVFSVYIYNHETRNLLRNIIQLYVYGLRIGIGSAQPLRNTAFLLCAITDEL